MKYAALTLSTVATALLALALVGMANQIGTAGRSLPPVRNDLAPLSAQQMADQADVQQALHALGQWPSARLLAPPTGVNSGAPAENMSAMDGYLFALSSQSAETPSSRRRPIDAPAMAVPALALPRVTVVLESGAGGKAVVDGQLVRVGDAVADGMVVSSINVDSVMFSAGKEVVEVRMPLDRLRVLGAFPGSSKGN